MADSVPQKLPGKADETFAKYFNPRPLVPKPSRKEVLVLRAAARRAKIIRSIAKGARIGALVAVGAGLIGVAGFGAYQIIKYSKEPVE